MDLSETNAPRPPRPPTVPVTGDLIALASVVLLTAIGAVVLPDVAWRIAVVVPGVSAAAFAMFRAAQHWRLIAWRHAGHSLALQERLTLESKADQQRQNELFESRLLGRLRLDSSGRVLAANGAASQLFGTSPGGLVGRAVHDLLPGLWQQARESQRAGESGPPRRLRATPVLHGERPLDVDAALTLTEGGGGLVEVVDVTAETAARGEVRAARQSAAELLRVRTELLSQLSYAVRAPMNSALALVALVADDRVAATHQGLIAHIQTSSRTFLDLVDELLDLSRLEAGAAALRDVDLDLLTLVEDAVARQAQQGARSRAWVLEAEPEVVRSLIGDAVRLRQLLANVLQYAGEQGTPGPRVVTVSSEPQLCDGRVMVNLSVRAPSVGAGGGGGEGTTERDATAGLGFTIARGLAERMGGEVRDGAGVGSEEIVAASVPLARAVLRVASDRHPNLAGSEVVVALPFGPEARAVTEHLKALGARVARVGDAVELATAAPGRDVVIADAGLLARMAGGVGLRGEGPMFVAVDLLDEAVEGAAIPVPVATWLDRPLRLSTLGGEVEVLLERARERSAVPPVVTSAARVAHREPLALLVEDDAVNQLIATRMLEDLGVTVEIVDNGLDGLEAAASGAYDVVLLDCQLPGLDGFEVAQRLRAGSTAGARVPIVALTGHVMPADIARCRAAGMNGHLAKPFTREHLAAAVAPWLVPGGRAGSRAWAGVAPGGRVLVREAPSSFRNARTVRGPRVLAGREAAGTGVNRRRSRREGRVAAL